MWNDIWVMGIPVLDKGIRTVTVYLFITLALRLVGRRDLAQFTTFDLVVVLLLSNVVQNAIIGPDNSLTGGLLGAAMLFAVNSLLVRIGTATDTAERIFEGEPTTIAENGELKHQVLRRLGVRPRDVEAALSRWRMAAALPHRGADTGRCRRCGTGPPSQSEAVRKAA